MTISFRPATEADVAAIHRVRLIHDQERGRPSTLRLEDTQREWFGTERFEAATMSRLALDGTEVVAWSGFEIYGEELNGDGYVQPSHRGLGIGTDLTRWLVASAQAHGVGRAYTWTPAERDDAVRLLEAEGFVRARSFLTMVHRSPASIAPAEIPPGITLRAVEADEAARLAAEGWNASFIDHWNFHPRTPGDFAEVLEHAEEDPALWTFAFDGATLAGFCLTRVRTGDGVVRGQLGPIGTARSHRGIGLGRALLRNGVRALADRRVDEVALGVDSENLSGAVRLYTSDGFVPENEGHVYRFDL